MRKITFLLTLLSVFVGYSQSQTCTQYFEIEGYDDDPTVLTINASDIMCTAGQINSVTITEAFLGDIYAWLYEETPSCNGYYGFTLNIDGVSTAVCGADLIGMIITDFETLTITTSDMDDDSDYMRLEISLLINYELTNVPDCTIITGPLSNTEAALNGVLTWSATQGVDGYMINVGTTPGGNDVVASHTVTNHLTYNIPGTLAANQDHYVSIIPFNALGEALGCEEYFFTTPVNLAGNTCENAVIINSLPFSIIGDTVDNFDAVYEGSPGGTGCGSTNTYLNGNDVVYSYTATFSGAINLMLTPTATWTGMFVYNSCEDIGTACVAGGVNPGTTDMISVIDFEVTEGETYYVVISTYADPQTTGYTLHIVENTCTNPTATYTVVSDCASGESQYLVNVDITSLGTASSLTISDNVGSDNQIVSSTGIATFGPYVVNVPVIFTINNNDDSNCFIVSGAQNMSACPPINDNCTEAIELTPANTFALSAIQATNFMASRNEGDHNISSVSPTCDVSGFETDGKDVWFTTVVPASGSITIETAAAADSYLSDTGMYVYGGDCSTQTYISCSSDIGDGNNFSKVELTDRTPGETIYVRVFGYNGSSGSFIIGAYDASLSTSSFEVGKITGYPNPVNDVLHVSHVKNIDVVEVYNLLGQKVINKTVNNTQDVISMQGLTSGTYLVKVISNHEVQTMKVIKN